MDIYTPDLADKSGKKHAGSGSAVLYYSENAEKYDYLYLLNQLEFTCKECEKMNVKIIAAFDGVDKSIEPLLEKWIRALENGIECPKKALRGFKQITAFK